MSENQPLLRELLQTCEVHNLHKSLGYLTYEVYLHLCEVLKLWDVEYVYNEASKNFVLLARTDKNSEKEVYVPVSSSQQISLEEIKEAQNLAHLGVKSISKGLIKPSSPEVIMQNKEAVMKREAFEKQILQKKRHLYSKAMMNNDKG